MTTSHCANCGVEIVVGVTTPTTPVVAGWYRSGSARVWVSWSGGELRISDPVCVRCHDKLIVLGGQMGLFPSSVSDFYQGDK